MGIYEELQQEIEKHRGRCLKVSDGPANVTPAEWFEAAEARLGFVLPPSYKWVFQRYTGLIINGYEVYEIAPPEFWDRGGIHLTGQWDASRESGSFPAHELLLYATDFGENFVLDTSRETSPGEFPVYMYLGVGNRSFYTDNYAGFLVRLLREHCAEGAKAPG